MMLSWTRGLTSCMQSEGDTFMQKLLEGTCRLTYVRARSSTVYNVLESGLNFLCKLSCNFSPPLDFRISFFLSLSFSSHFTVSSQVPACLHGVSQQSKINMDRRSSSFGYNQTNKNHYVPCTSYAHSMCNQKQQNKNVYTFCSPWTCALY